MLAARIRQPLPAEIASASNGGDRTIATASPLSGRGSNRYPTHHDGKDANMTRLRLIRLVQLGVFLATTACALGARSQSSDGSSLADRIRDLRRGSSADSVSAADDPTATTPVQTDEPSPRPRAAASAGQTGLPQINAKSLIPSNLFGRPSASPSPSESKEPQPMPKRGPMAAVKKAPPTTVSPSNSPEPSHRYVASDPSSTSPAKDDEADHRGGEAGRRPAHRNACSTLRSQFARAAHAAEFRSRSAAKRSRRRMPAPADKQQSASSSKASTAASPKHNDSASVTSPTEPAAENQPAPQPANRGHYEVTPSPSSHEATIESHQPFPTVGDLLGHRAGSPSKTAAPSEAPAAANDADTRESGTKAFQTSAKPRSSPSVKPGPVTVTPVKSSESAAGHFNTLPSSHR